MKSSPSCLPAVDESGVMAENWTVLSRFITCGFLVAKAENYIMSKDLEFCATEGLGKCLWYCSNVRLAPALLSPTSAVDSRR